MSKKDITSKVMFSNNDGELLPITECICGQKFNFWEFAISIYEDSPDVCCNCGRKLFFSNTITVYEIID